MNFYYGHHETKPLEISLPANLVNSNIQTGVSVAVKCRSHAAERRKGK